VQFDSDDPGKPKDPFELWLESRIKEKIGENGTKAQLFLDTLRSNVPSMMLACVPLFAFVLKLLYVRQRRYYVEHLVYALHIHTFAYVAVVVITLIGMAVERVLPAVQPFLIVVLSFVAVGQVFFSIRRVYGQSWFMTVFKFMLGGVIYFTVIVLALTATAFITLIVP
jgi:Mn2+/Fe2+ NRAMP family transporter